MKYSELAAINVNEHVEKKQNLSYLSWAWAVDTLLKMDENAAWEYSDPKYFKDTMMVFCTVNAFGRSRTAQLPVMDHRNKAISEPDAFQVNVAMQRCLAKAIALHGIGLYIYAGEDLPSDDAKTPSKADAPAVEVETKAAAEEPVESSPIQLPDSKQVVIPDNLESEGAIVDWIVAFMEEFIPSMQDTEQLRDFWRVNKANLSRVQTFSLPKYKQIESAFTTKAKELKNV
jgi:hypothetical protein